MRVKEWAALEGLNEQTVWKWCREGRMPVAVEKAGSVWLVHDPKYEASGAPAAGSRTVCYVRVSSADQKVDLQRQADRLKAFALNLGASGVEVVSEVGSGVNGKRRTLNRILADPTVGTIIVELMRDMTEVLTSLCARLYGRRAARSKAEAALKAALDA
ncbi:MAG: recombinase family protein [Thermobifida sp.]|nr:recombinase family protein [Thermobifida sp.]